MKKKQKRKAKRPASWASNTGLVRTMTSMNERLTRIDAMLELVRREISGQAGKTQAPPDHLNVKPWPTVTSIDATAGSASK